MMMMMKMVTMVKLSRHSRHRRHPKQARTAQGMNAILSTACHAALAAPVEPSDEKALMPTRARSCHANACRTQHNDVGPRHTVKSSSCNSDNGGPPDMCLITRRLKQITHTHTSATPQHSTRNSQLRLSQLQLSWMTSVVVTCTCAATQHNRSMKH